MNILVTGGAGFVGTNLIKRLLREGHSVVSMDDYSTGTRKNHIDGCMYLFNDINNIQDIVDNPLPMDLEDIDYCFHLAALPRIQPSFDNPDETYRVNTTGTHSILSFCWEYNIKVIYSGSSSRWHDPYQSPYATTKYLGEELCKMYRRVYNLDAQIVRFYNVYGPHEITEGDWAAVIGKWRGQIERGDPITIVGDGEQRRDFTHIDDIVDALYKIMLNETVEYTEPWELGTGISYSIKELYEMFCERFGSVEVKYLPEQKGNYRSTQRETDRALDALGWEPQDRLKDYIKGL